MVDTISEQEATQLLSDCPDKQQLNANLGIWLKSARLNLLKMSLATFARVIADGANSPTQSTFRAWERGDYQVPGWVLLRVSVLVKSMSGSEVAIDIPFCVDEQVSSSGYADIGSKAPSKRDKNMSYPFSSMQVGESFSVPISEKSKLIAAASAASKRLQKRFVTKRDGDKQLCLLMSNSL